MKNPKVIVLNFKLELKADKENEGVRIEFTKEYQAIIDEEWEIIYEKLYKIVSTGAKRRNFVSVWFCARASETGTCTLSLPPWAAAN